MRGSIRHVNNVKILGYFESARIRFCESWSELLPNELIQDILVRLYHRYPLSSLLQFEV